MIVGDLARTEGEGRWATLAASHLGRVHDNGGSRLHHPKLVGFGEVGWFRRQSLRVAGPVTSRERGLGDRLLALAAAHRIQEVAVGLGLAHLAQQQLHGFHWR